MACSGGNRTVPPRWRPGGLRGGDQLDQQSVRIGKREDLLIEAASGSGVLDALAQQALDPEPQRC